MSKTSQGHRTKLNKTKRTEAPTVSSCGQTTVILWNTITITKSLSNDDRKSTVFSSRRNVVSDGAFMTDDGKLSHAGAKATGKARSPSVERLVDGTTSMAVSDC